MKIIGIGRNYVAHAQELNNPVPDSPLIFLKPDTALLRTPNKKDFYIPEFTENVHFECELVLRISREGKHIQPEFVPSYLDGVGLGIDFTARDVQSDAKKKGWPWALAKGFDHSAPVSPFFSMDQFPDLQDIHFSLKINGEIRQEGYTGNMIFKCADLICYVSKFITLKKGDLIFTGTPKGVGPVKIGDHLEGFLGEDKILEVYVK